MCHFYGPGWSCLLLVRENKDRVDNISTVSLKDAGDISHFC